jgi:hypothetical protein
MRAITQASTGHYITVVDLRVLFDGTTKNPRTIAEFLASKHQAINQLAFSADGNSVMVSPKDGQVLHVFQLRPTPLALNTGDAKTYGVPWHVYDLTRGRTSTVVEGVEWAEDGRWIAIETRKHTIHVFVVNSYGGEADLNTFHSLNLLHCTPHIQSSRSSTVHGRHSRTLYLVSGASSTRRSNCTMDATTMCGSIMHGWKRARSGM